MKPANISARRPLPLEYGREVEDYEPYKICSDNEDLIFISHLGDEIHTNVVCRHPLWVDERRDKKVGLLLSY